VILVSVLSIGVLTGCGINEEDKSEELSTTTGEMLEETEELEPKIGEYFEIEYSEYGEELGLLGIKVVSVTETDERLLDETDIEHIALVEFEFTNKTGSAITLGISDFNVIDTDGFQGQPYLVSSVGDGELWLDLPKDGKGRANFRYEVGTPGPYSVQVGDIIVK